MKTFTVNDPPHFSNWSQE